MWNHNLKLAFRNFSQHRVFSLINVLGLAIGIASCVLIGLYAIHELSFDRFHSGYSQIYRINKVTNEKKKAEQRDGITPGELVPELRKDVPEVSYATRYRPWFNDMLVSYDTIGINLGDVAYADEDFLQVFDFPLVRGDRKTALAQPFTAVITESTARLYFKDADPMGKTLLTLNDIPVTVSGIAKDVPANSSLQFTMLISWGTTTAPATAGYFSWMNNWITQVNFSFVKLQKDADAGRAADKISSVLHKNLPEREYEYEPYLQPLKDIHLKSSDLLYVGFFRSNSGSIIYTLLIVAAFILLIACFNFINLSTAGALGRAKETAVQKILGAGRGQLVRKFFGESFLLCAIALVVALLLVQQFLPTFNLMANTELASSWWYDKSALLALGSLFLLISVLAGLYPAVFLAGFKSTDIFRKVIKAGKNIWLRKSLVTIQFTLSILLIVATLVVQKQMRFLLTKDLGFDQEQLLVLPLTNTSLETKAPAFMEALRQSPDITAISATNRVPGQSFNGYGIVPEGHSEEEHLMATVLETDADFLQTYHIELAEGRYFSPDMPTDTAEGVVINEAMMRYLDWDQAVGKHFEIFGARKGRVIGVMKDFNVGSLREEVPPLAIMLKDNPLYLSLKIRPGASAAALDFIQNTWRQFESKHPFNYTFLDEKLDNFYQSDARLLNILSIFAGLAIFLVCLGLFGLSIYSTRQRTKEIGIRKVLGASVLRIVTLLTKDFLWLTIIAAVIAFPTAWYFMRQWLGDFAYRIEMQWWMFALAGVLAAAIAFLTISLQSIKVALANPVESLRSE